MKKYTIIITSVMVDAEVLRYPVRSNEVLNTVIAQACADTGGNGDV